MDITIAPSRLKGSISVIPSKSQAHRYLICAAFADRPTELLCSQVNRDMDATAACLNALGAEITRTPDGYHVIPAENIPERADLPCRDSGSTLRFLLPVAGALGVKAVFHMEGRLPSRPLSPLWEEMERMGCRLSRPTESTILSEGRLQSGKYRISGSVSSQFISGLLFASALIPGDTSIALTGKVESRPYIDMTIKALEVFSLPCPELSMKDPKVLRSPGSLQVEGDWSNGAFFLTAKALGNPIEVLNLPLNSCQGDRAIAELLPRLSQNPEISVADIPDLTPILAVAASQLGDTVFTDIRRLRLKESDRVESILSMVRALGGKAEADQNSLKVYKSTLTGGTVDSKNDHRIAMAAAIASTVCKEKVTILGAACVEKSYPRFFEEFKRLGGNYEQYIR